MRASAPLSTLLLLALSHLSTAAPSAQADLVSPMDAADAVPPPVPAPGPPVADGAPAGCHPRDFVDRCTVSADENTKAINTQKIQDTCKPSCWPAIDGRDPASWDVQGCADCLKGFIGGANNCNAFWKPCGLSEATLTGA